jgi:peptide/nickel transport system ATP-binding protein
MALLEMHNLSITYQTSEGAVPAVRGVTLSLDPGETLGVAGESGCGKSTIASSVLRLLPKSANVSGELLFNGENILTMTYGQIRAVRWAGASIIFQGAMHSLNPVQKIGKQLAEPILLHDPASQAMFPSLTKRSELKRAQAAAKERVAELLAQVGLTPSRADNYPHELSGGQKQRVMIAMALACKPYLIVADEPTTALDVMIQAQVLKLIGGLVKETGVGMMMISHDLSVLSETCDRLVVMYAGRIVEEGPANQVFNDARHPYSEALSWAFPIIGDQETRMHPRGLPGDPPDPADLPSGCPFHPRCKVAEPHCSSTDVKLWPAGEKRLAACVHVLPDHGRGLVAQSAGAPDEQVIA